MDANDTELPTAIQQSTCGQTFSESVSPDDPRFRTLLGEQGWNRLPSAVQKRFGKRLQGGATAVYVGLVTECRLSLAGRLLAQVVRPLGGPLPTSTDTGVAASVSVTEDEASNGQFWTRLYAQHNGFPKIIQSSKRFCGCTGLEEYIGHGIGMALTVHADSSGLYFLSDHYFVQVGPVHWQLPRWLTPGLLKVAHLDRGQGQFDFELSIVHPLLGELVFQNARFADCDRRTC